MNIIYVKFIHSLWLPTSLEHLLDLFCCYALFLHFPSPTDLGAGPLCMTATQTAAGALLRRDSRNTCVWVVLLIQNPTQAEPRLQKIYSEISKEIILAVKIT